MSKKLYPSEPLYITKITWLFSNLQVPTLATCRHANSCISDIQTISDYDSADSKGLLTVLFIVINIKHAQKYLCFFPNM